MQLEMRSELQLTHKSRAKCVDFWRFSAERGHPPLIQVLQASVTGLVPKRKYVLALAEHADGTGALQPLAAFMTNPAGSAIVNATGPIRQIVGRSVTIDRRYLVIAPGDATMVGAPVQI